MPVPPRPAACLAALVCIAAVAHGVLVTDVRSRNAVTQASALQANASRLMMVSREDARSQDTFCDLAEDFFRSIVQGKCQTENKVTCVYASFPQCSDADVCNKRNGCGFVEDNRFVKFAGHHCKGIVGWDGGKPTGDFQLGCKPRLTHISIVILFVGALILVLASSWLCCCCRR
uniref:PSI domain-containing protein n=1 Tax=Alexandrium catenella TaxID=2925 RepID=A0A7S1R2Q8_ALECA|mmetsp:Transcript_43484/g.117272  ORF Transcript_43484/g.117272 Transcript_43484/m.117272 type:complete len:174 (+) Transcript_43484:96-617(+)